MKSFLLVLAILSINFAYSQDNAFPNAQQCIQNYFQRKKAVDFIEKIIEMDPLPTPAEGAFLCRWNGFSLRGYIQAYHRSRLTEIGFLYPAKKAPIIKSFYLPGNLLASIRDGKKVM